MTIGREDDSHLPLVPPRLIFTTLHNLSLQLGADILRHLASVPGSSSLIWRAPVRAAEDSHSPVDLIFWPVPRGHPSSFHSSWAIWERARQEPWGVSVCSLYLYSVLLKTGLSRSCQAYLNDTWEKRASPWFLSSPSFNYPMLNHSSVTLGISDLHPGPANYKVTQYYQIEASFCFP